MKVLQVHNSYQLAAGEDAVVRDEMSLLEAHGHTVVPYRRDNAEIKTDDLFGRGKLAFNTIWSHRSYREILSLINSEKPDVAHFHNTLPLISPSAYWACFEAGVPTVQTLHNYRMLCPVATFYRNGRLCQECVDHSLIHSIRYGCYRNSRTATATISGMLYFHRWKRTWAEMIDTYIALSEFSRTKFIEAGWSADNIVVKPNFIYPDPGFARPAGKYAIFAGRLSHEKGLWTLLHAWQKLDSIPLKVVGSGPLAEELQVAMQHNHVKGIEMVRHCNRNQVLELIKDARFLVFPSEWYEAFPMVIAEAFACGVPVIASRLGAMQEIVENGCTGLHFNPGDPEDLAAKVEWAWTHEEELRQMGEQARKIYEQRFSPERNYQTLMEIYELAIQRRRYRFVAEAGMQASVRSTQSFDDT